MMDTLITVIHVVVALFMIIVVLIQGGNSGGVGAAFGGGNSSGVFGATGANQFLTKLTYGAAAIFMFTSISLTVLQGKAGKTGLMNKLEAGAPSAPASTEAPVAATPAAPAAAAPATAAPAAAGTTEAPAAAPQK
jgi:preprotein translocase subunit SecG